MESEEDEEFPPSIYEESFVGASGGASADRSQLVVGCGTPPLDLRPNLILLACFLSLPSLGFAGAAGLSEGSSGPAVACPQPTLNGDHGSARNWGFYIDDRYGVDITAPLHRTDNHDIADFFTRPFPPQARFYDNPSFYGIEPNSEGSDTDSGYGSGMDEVD
ncbi:hypothetical protein CYMTET_13027 [Cymbomonas tetramitiformis]|uniref:Uncharacterized protein n=1 Tax=Cymbomonas tetramitiformis TaxID=36881 RepID=A0AAE0GIX5_9CHLO|nr:hypothetical protein CYMTET_13027 [Cymbomonas tetramitiformis]